MHEMIGDSQYYSILNTGAYLLELKRTGPDEPFGGLVPRHSWGPCIYFPFVPHFLRHSSPLPEVTFSGAGSVFPPPSLTAFDTPAIVSFEARIVVGELSRIFTNITCSVVDLSRVLRTALVPYGNINTSQLRNLSSYNDEILQV